MLAREHGQMSQFVCDICHYQSGGDVLEAGVGVAKLFVVQELSDSLFQPVEVPVALIVDN